VALPSQGQNFANKYGELVEWMSDELAHSLAKKLTQNEVDRLKGVFNRIARVAREAEKEAQNLKLIRSARDE
jgi:phage tail tape-measure protein